MRKYSPGLLLICILATGCSKEPQPRAAVTTSVVLSSSVFSIPAMTGSGQQNLADAPALFRLDSFINAAAPGYTRSEIRGARADSCWVELTAGDALNNFANYSKLRIDIYNAKLPAYAAVAGADNVPDEFSFNKTLPTERKIDFRNYFQSDSFRFRIAGTLRRPTKRPLEGRIRARFSLALTD